MSIGKDAEYCLRLSETGWVPGAGEVFSEPASRVRMRGAKNR